jgi:hypothetical protein
MIASLIALSLFSSSALAQTVSTSGTCPGVVRIDVSGVTPGGNYYILRGNAAGATPLPGGPCAGVSSGLSSVTSFFGAFSASAGGTASLAPSVPGSAAGSFISVLDPRTCTVSRAVALCEAGDVRSFNVGDGPPWSPGIEPVSCLEACAMLFGGSTSDWSCSTRMDTIDRQAYVSGWGDPTHCTVPVDEDFVVGDTTDCGRVGCYYSAYVADHCGSSINYCHAR